MTLFRAANRYLKNYWDVSKVFGVAFAVKDAHGLIGAKFNSLGAARAWAKRISLNNRGVKLRIWSGRGFTVSVGISYRDGRRGR